MNTYENFKYSSYPPSAEETAEYIRLQNGEIRRLGREAGIPIGSRDGQLVPLMHPTDLIDFLKSRIEAKKPTTPTGREVAYVVE